MNSPKACDSNIARAGSSCVIVDQITKAPNAENVPAATRRYSSQYRRAAVQHRAKPAWILVVVSAIDEDTIVEALPAQASPRDVVCALAAAKTDHVGALLDANVAADCVVIGSIDVLARRSMCGSRMPPARQDECGSRWPVNCTRGTA